MTPRLRALLMLAVGIGALTAGARLARDAGVVRHRVLAAREAAMTLARAEEEILRMEVLEDSAGRVRARFEQLAARVLPGGYAEEAGAAMTAAIARAAAESGGALVEGIVEPDTMRIGPLHRVRVSVSGTLPAGNLPGLLRAIATQPFALAMNRLDLTAASPGQVFAPTDQMQFDVTLLGWFVRSRLPWIEP